jgi:hypothetical protein
MYTIYVWWSLYNTRMDIYTYNVLYTVMIITDWWLVSLCDWHIKLYYVHFI